MLSHLLYFRGHTNILWECTGSLWSLAWSNYCIRTVNVSKTYLKCMALSRPADPLGVGWWKPSTSSLTEQARCILQSRITAFILLPAVQRHVWGQIGLVVTPAWSRTVKLLPSFEFPLCLRSHFFSHSYLKLSSRCKDEAVLLETELLKVFIGTH